MLIKVSKERYLMCHRVFLHGSSDGMFALANYTLMGPKLIVFMFQLKQVYPNIHNELYQFKLEFHYNSKT